VRPEIFLPVPWPSVHLPNLVRERTIERGNHSSVTPTPGGAFVRRFTKFVGPDRKTNEGDSSGTNRTPDRSLARSVSFAKALLYFFNFSLRLHPRVG
jgi:hypothetical protein